MLKETVITASIIKTIAISGSNFVKTGGDDI